MRTISTLLFCLFAGTAFAQSLSLITPLSNNLIESSGLLYLNGKLITHTDSGGETALYEIDTATGLENRKVYISNVTNIDWEDITSDQNNIYIGDFGNNQGNRTNLRIYKIALQDYWTKDTVEADTLTFDYSDQTDFSTTSFTTNFDAEAMISLGDSLYIFTKNWGNGLSYIYPIAKNPGNYSLVKTDSINAQGLITGAVYDSTARTITLIGYTFSDAFFIQIQQWSNLFSTGSVIRNVLAPNSSIQIEGIALIDATNFFITSEKFQTTISELHVLNTDFATNTNNFRSNITHYAYPNPAQSEINIPFNNNEVTTSIFDFNGHLLIRTKKNKIELDGIKAGTYILQIRQQKQLISHQKISVL